MNSLKLQDIRSTYKNQLCLYTLTTKHLKKKQNYPIHIGIKNNKVLRNKFNQVKDLYNENYQTLMKEIEENANKWKDILHLWIRRLILLKYPYYPKPSTDSTQSMSKFQWRFSQN